MTVGAWRAWRWVGVLGATLGLMACALAPAPDTRRSGFDFMSPSTQAMQRDDSQNPGMLWVLEGASLWERKVGHSVLACADCHNAAATSIHQIPVKPRLWRHQNTSS